jgi:hypothetical protein
MPLAAARAVPPAVETDVYRALVLVPGVSFTSPLSARPLLRGYDAQEVTTRIDGFEVLNLYHLGRVFSSFPADAADQLTVAAAPGPASQGGSAAGIVDVSGRTGSPGRLRGGGGTSFGSLAAWVGGGGRAGRYFTGARLLHLKSLDLIPGVEFPYHFVDWYGAAVFGPVERPSARLTAFASQDDVGDDQQGLRWSNLLVGGRWRPRDRGLASVELSGSAARFTETGTRVPSLRRATADLRNAFARLSVGADIAVTGYRWRLAAGSAAGWRQIENRVIESDPFGPAGSFPAANTRLQRLELAGYVELVGRVGDVVAQAGLRADRAGTAASLEPRVQIGWSVSGWLELGAAAGRASRLYHLIADARSEPDLEYLDFWLEPEDSIPVARVDHASIDASVSLAPVVARISAFGSRGTGLGELRPESDQATGSFPFFRFGRARTIGVEAQVGLRGDDRRRHSLSLSSSHSLSQRNWGHGWTRWAQDRRHQLRAFGQVQLGRITTFAAVDAASGMPVTPIIGRITRQLPGGDAAGPGPLADAVIYGQENSLGTSGTFRVDAGASLSFGGPDGRRFTLGVSVINLLGGAVAPIADQGEGEPALDAAGRPTHYRRLFRLPPIPTLTLRGEF